MTHPLNPNPFPYAREEGFNVHCTPFHRAGHFGSLADCDAPLALFESLFHSLNQSIERGDQAPIDLAVATGDFFSHDLIDDNQTHVLQSVKLVNDLMEKFVPGVPFVPAVGNHEGLPVNQ